ncbi:MAG: 50S ribosomal protein L3 [bacterium]|nr:50S ribosomal protein L3 [bacterium]
MLSGFLGKKIGMTQIFTETGEVVPVTVVEAGPGYVTQIKQVEKEGYNAVQLGFSYSQSKSVPKVNSAIKGILKKAGLTEIPINHFREFKLIGTDSVKLGQKITCAEIFKVGEKVDVAGTSKGRGFAGGMKRHNWKGGRASRGSMFHREPGSIGTSADPSRVLKGKRLPGHMGVERVTIQGLTIRGVDAERNILLIQGSIPGWNSGIVEIKHTVKK